MTWRRRVSFWERKERSRRRGKKDEAKDASSSTSPSLPFERRDTKIRDYSLLCTKIAAKITNPSPLFPLLALAPKAIPSAVECNTNPNVALKLFS